MGQTISVQKPDRPIHGATIQKSTIAGRKNEFVLQSTTATGSITLAAGATGSVSSTATFWATDLPTTAQNAQNLIQPGSVILFPQWDIYIDTDNTGGQYIATGSTLTADQKLITMGQMTSISPPVYSGSQLYSGYMLAFFHNFGASSHTIYIHLKAQYIVYADVNL